MALSFSWEILIGHITKPRGRKSLLPLFSVTDLAAIPPQSGLCGLPLSVVSLVLLIWASCWDHGLLILRTKRRLIELVRPEAVSVLIRRHLTSLEDLGGAWQNNFLIGLLSRYSIASEQKLSESMLERQTRHISVHSAYKQYRRLIWGELQADSHLSYLSLILILKSNILIKGCWGRLRKESIIITKQKT